MTNRPASANRLSEHIRAAIRRTVRAAGATRLVVACSGGADSVCLAHAMAPVAREQTWSLIIAHVRHGMRPDDDKDATLVAELAAALGVPFVLRELAFGTDGQPVRSIEATLREARYAALEAVAADAGAQTVLTGHTLDDQAETVLLHLLRGAGTDGLAGMGTVRPLPGSTRTRSMTLVRPLLTIRREETHAYCMAHSLMYFNDPTNNDDHFARNWMRHHALPLLGERYPAVASVLARTAALIGDEADFLRHETRAALAACVRWQQADLVVLDAQHFAATHAALQRRMLHELVAQYSDELGRMESIEHLRRAALAPSSSLASIGHVACCRAYGAVFIGMPDAVVQRVRVLAAQQHPLMVGDMPVRPGEPVRFPHMPGMPHYSLAVRSAANIAAGEDMRGMRWLRLADDTPLHLRTRRPGDQFHAPGHARAMPLRVYLMERAVPRSVRDQVPMLMVGDAICWVLGYDIAAPFAADAATATHGAVLITDDRLGDDSSNEESERQARE